MKRTVRAVVVTALAAAGVFGTTALAGPASAATRGVVEAQYNGVCGKGFEVVDFYDLDKLGTMYLTWNEKTGEACAVTVRSKPGARLYMHAKLYQMDHNEISDGDSGAFTTYAGPVTIPARGECIAWRGQIADQYLVQNYNCD